MLTSKQAKEAIRKAARPALQPTLAAARSYAPRKTGRLKRSIKIRAISRSRTRVGARVTTAKGDNQFKGKTFYAGFQEWGWKTGRRTSNRDLGADKNKRRTSSQRAEAASRNDARKRKTGLGFLKKAARSTRIAALDLYQQGILQYIRNVAKG